jgi:hypothetical protein
MLVPWLAVETLPAMVLCGLNVNDGKQRFVRGQATCHFPQGHSAGNPYSVSLLVKIRRWLQPDGSQR